MQFRKSLPSLTALVALEAVIRHRSVTLAAGELGVTQAAVSRQIALLETEFGTPLFIRGHRSIEPTAACRTLGEILANSFNNIVDGVDAIRSSTGPDVVTIGTSLAVAALWLLPRLAEFRQLHPGVQLRLVSQDARLNLEGGDVDIALRFGTPPFPDGTVLASRDDTVFPVCAPAYLPRCGVPDFWREDAELIETASPDRGWYRWPDWLARAGYRIAPYEPALRFSHYTETVAAARAGQGVALGWQFLVERFLQDGSLVRIGTDAVTPEGRYNLVVPLKAKRSGIRDIAASWMTRAIHS